MNAVFKALSDPTRREILRLLTTGEMSAGAIADKFALTKPSVSHHFTVLKEADLVRSRRDGQQIFYALNTTVVQDVMTCIWDLFGGPPGPRQERCPVTRAYWIASIALGVAVLAASAIVYPSLPARVPIHWNVRGEVDGFGSRAFGAFFFPGVILILIGVFAVLPKLTPRSMPIATFGPTYAYIVLLTTALFSYIHVLAIAAAMGHAPDFPRALLGGMFLFFALMGNVLGKVTRNPYVGIKVPWTLASDAVWNATHRLAAWLFVASGVIGLILVAARAPSWTMPIPLVLASIAPVVYSYVLSRKLKASGEL